VLLEQARMLLCEDNAVQLAMQHTDEAMREADRRAAMLEDWYGRTYSAADSASHLPSKRSGSVSLSPGPSLCAGAFPRITYAGSPVSENITFLGNR
jgi:hypothetical protein